MYHIFKSFSFRFTKYEYYGHTAKVKFSHYCNSKTIPYVIEWFVGWTVVKMTSFEASLHTHMPCLGISNIDPLVLAERNSLPIEK